MTTINERLAEMRARVEAPNVSFTDWETRAEAALDDLPKLLTFARWVANRHFADDCESPGPHCEHDGQRWPCDDIRALIEALDVTP